ncbi:MAG: hypothetical protein IJK43_05825 [Prevotella sp.]|nr:hypothetical protein [Prevotella sp.]
MFGQICNSAEHTQGGRPRKPRRTAPPSLFFQTAGNTDFPTGKWPKDMHLGYAKNVIRRIDETAVRLCHETITNNK